MLKIIHTLCKLSQSMGKILHIVAAHKLGKGYKMISKCLELSVATVKYY